MLAIVVMEQLVEVLETTLVQAVVGGLIMGLVELVALV
jgi:hypothetical protein